MSLKGRCTRLLKDENNWQIISGTNCYITARSVESEKLRNNMKVCDTNIHGPVFLVSIYVNAKANPFHETFSTWYTFCRLTKFELFTSDSKIIPVIFSLKCLQNSLTAPYPHFLYNWNACIKCIICRVLQGKNWESRPLVCSSVRLFVQPENRGGGFACKFVKIV